jgi:hypothetical protein
VSEAFVSEIERLRGELRQSEQIIKSLGRLVSEAQIPPQWYREIQAALADLDDRISTVERAYNDAQRLEEIGGLS